MRKLKLLVQISVDGFIADKNGKTDWMIWHWGDEWTWDAALRKYNTDLIQSIDCILLSRKMAEEGFVHHWENAAMDIKSSKYAFATAINKTPKLVFTKTLTASRWDNTEIANGDFVKVIKKLKKQKGKDMIVFGGATFVSSLIKAGLIDEYHLIINPVVLGEGLPIFNGISKKLFLTPVTTKLYSCGVTVAEYIPAG